MMKILGIGAVAYLLYLIQRLLYQKLWNKSLYARVSFGSSYIMEGEEGELLEIIENRKRLPLPMLKVKFQTSRELVFADTGDSGVTDRYYRNDLFQIGGGERITRTLRFVGRKRGYYHIHGVDLVASDLFMTTEMVESMDMEGYFYVYPKPFQGLELQAYLQQINGEILSRRALVEDPFEYRGIREYQPFDDIRSVNWKATARVQGLMVNQKGYTTRQTIRVFVNVDDAGIHKKTDGVEASFQIAASIVRFFLMQGMKVALYCNGVDMLSSQPVEIRASAGNGQLDGIYRALARVDTSKPVAGFTEAFGEKLLTEGSGTQTFLVAPNHFEDFLELVGQYNGTGNAYVWFYPVWEKEDPKVPDWVKPHVRVLHIRDRRR